MTQALVIDPRYARIWIGNAPGDAGPPPAVLLCAMERKALNQTLNTSTAVIPDCDDPTIVAPVKRTPISKEVTITGSGYYEAKNRGALQAFMDQAVSKPVCFEIIAHPGAAVGDTGYNKINAFLTQFNTVGNNDQGYMQCELTFEGDGPLTWTPY